MQKLTGLDHMFLSLDTETTSAILGGFTMFDPPAEGQAVPDAAFMKQRLEERIPYIPAMARKMVQVPFALDHHYLAPIPDLDVGERISTVRVPAPGGPNEIAMKVSELMSTMEFPDPDWLWDLYVLEGLQDGGVAHLLRIHHGVIDGSTMPTVWDLLSDEPSTALPELAEQTSAEGYGQHDLLARGMMNAALKPVRMMEFQQKFMAWLRERMPDDGGFTLPSLAARIMPGDLGTQMRDLLNKRQRAAGQPEIIPYIPTMSPPSTTFNGKISANRHFVYSDMPFQRVRAVGKKAGTTINNVVVTLCAGAVRRYMEDHGGVPDQPLTVCTPVSLRHDEIEDPWANHVHMMFAELPTNVDDPAERLRIVTDNLTAAKANYDSMPVELLREASEFLPRDMFNYLVDTAMRLPDEQLTMPWNVVVSNIRGSKDPLYYNGLAVAGYWPASFLPPGGGISITLQSHVDKVCFGFIGAPEKTGDLWPLVGYMDAALDELEAAVGSGQPEPLQGEDVLAADPVAEGTDEQPPPTGEEPTPTDPTTFP